jgi:hypothetical protein
LTHQSVEQTVVQLTATTEAHHPLALLVLAAAAAVQMRPQQARAATVASQAAVQAEAELQ